MSRPSPNGPNGSGDRDTAGRFTKGNRGGPGNPRSRRVAEIRSLLFDTVSDGDLRAIIAKLVEMAKAGDLAATRELLDRMVGKPKSTVEVEQAALTEAELDEELEYALGQLASFPKAAVARPGEATS